MRQHYYVGAKDRTFKLAGHTPADPIDAARHVEYYVPHLRMWGTAYRRSLGPYVVLVMGQDKADEWFTPQFEHDCDACTYLGPYEFDGQRFELYFCDQNGWPTVIARYGPASNYCSGLGMHLPMLQEAEARAKLNGLIPDPKPAEV